SPMDRLSILWFRRLAHIDHAQCDRVGQIVGCAMQWLAQDHGLEADRQFAAARLASRSRWDVYFEPALFAQTVDMREQQIIVLLLVRLDPPVLTRPHDQMRALWSEHEVLVNVA